MYYVWGKPSISRPTQTRPVVQEASGSSAAIRKREKCKRKRQSLVWRPEEEVWHEPYMVCLHKEFSEASIPCDSTLELPWKDIALPLTGMRIRPEVQVQSAEVEVTAIEQEIGKKESTGRMELPWNDLLISDVLQPRISTTIANCDSTVEIPWSQLALEATPDIKPLPTEAVCTNEDIEVPWDDIMIPRNIIISTKTRKHPSNLTKRRPQSGKCEPCNRCPKAKSTRKLPAAVKCTANQK